MESKILHEGYLTHHIRTVTKNTLLKRYFVLFGQAERAQPRLEFFENKQIFLGKPATRKSIFIEEIIKLQHGIDQGLHADNVFKVTKSGGMTYTLSASSGKEAKKWVSVINDCRKARLIHPGIHSGASAKLPSECTVEQYDKDALYASAPSVRSFEVIAQRTESTRRCGMAGLYKLTVGVRCIRISRRESDEIILSWPYNYIRRYGLSDKMFTFEAGRYCESGEGVFNFDVENGEEIFKEVQRRSKALQNFIDNGRPVSPRELTNDSRNINDKENLASTAEGLTIDSKNKNQKDSLDSRLDSSAPCYININDKQDNPTSTYMMTDFKPPPIKPKPPPKPKFKKTKNDTHPEAINQITRNLKQLKKATENEAVNSEYDMMNKKNKASPTGDYYSLAEEKKPAVKKCR